jgi:acyl-CoA thioesterase-1
VPKQPRSLRLSSSIRRGRAALAQLAAISLVLFAGSARADEHECPDWASAFDTNGATFAIPTARQPLDILAIGSSSTEGVGASSPEHAYPAQLESELTHGEGIAADVRNAGIGGELAAKTLPRLLSALRSGWARLVIWQVGTNDAFVGVDEALFRATVERGVAAARSAKIPLLLIDPQFSLKAPDTARYERFVAIVDAVGAENHIPVLSRFAMMKRGGAKGALQLLSNDGLHMNDRGYRCIAHVIAEAIEGATGAKL